jgi:hypothetical protein
VETRFSALGRPTIDEHGIVPPDDDVTYELSIPFVGLECAPRPKPDPLWIEDLDELVLFQRREPLLEAQDIDVIFLQAH